ncbi:MAG: helix-turn-helix transcriptional regulator [Candidatus Cloacimonetes bacterium]|nr:helix-turn-helix transcriptional regulator [Candidatus Cloacimonadota bacterium]
MPVVFNLDVVMAQQKIRLKDLAKEIQITEANLSKLKNGHVKAIKISTLEKLCTALNCTPGNLLDFRMD